MIQKCLIGVAIFFAVTIIVAYLWSKWALKKTSFEGVERIPSYTGAPEESVPAYRYPLDATPRQIEMIDHVRPHFRQAALLKKVLGKTSSYFGGKPPAIKGLAWPKVDGRPLSFIACLDLSHVPEVEELEWVPKEGMLLFFYDADELPEGYKPEHGKGWKVLYFPWESLPKDKQEPVPDDWPESPLKRTFVEMQVINLPPPHHSDLVNELGLSLQDSLYYLKWRGSFFKEHYEHQLGGYPSLIHNDTMELECEAVASGLDLSEPASDPFSKEIVAKAKARSWKLLLQIEFDYPMNALWGDGGTIYFWVPEADARKKNFENVWAIIQQG